jgi:hypothetical protein
MFEHSNSFLTESEVDVLDSIQRSKDPAVLRIRAKTEVKLAILDMQRARKHIAEMAGGEEGVKVVDKLLGMMNALKAVLS